MKLRVLTINLYNGRADPDSLAAALDRHKPDVVAAQELSANAAEILEAWSISSYMDPRDDLTGMGIAARQAATFERLSFPNRQPVVAKLDRAAWDLPTDVEVVNAHLVNPIARPLPQSRRLRTAELTALHDLLANRAESTGRILVGDLNSSPAWPLYRQLAKLATDAAVAAGTARRTWGPRPASPRLLRIDHAFVQGLVPTQTTLVPIKGSDHTGLLVDVGFDR